jgi:hypothetical protein
MRPSIRVASSRLGGIVPLVHPAGVNTPKWPMSPKQALIRVSRRDDIVQVDLLTPVLFGDAAVERAARRRGGR